MITQLTVPQRFSSVIINQNDLAPVDGFSPLASRIYQQFTLPHGYTRGEGTSEARTPPLTGFQVLIEVLPGSEDTVSLDWVLERYRVGDGWNELDRGQAAGVTRSGSKVWFTVYTSAPVEILSDWVDDTFRIGIESDTVTKVYVCYPNPLAVASSPTPSQAFESDGTTPLEILENVSSSLNFRILAGTGEKGTDFLGNQYRSTITKTSATSVSTVDSSRKDSFWMSKPNPSQFAVESLYFDISDGDKPTTVDHLLLDPLTPGINFNVYWSNEGDPATTEDGWDDKLWERIPNVFQAKSRFTHPLPQPVTARYIKVEFTHLQPKWYAPGAFQKPILYRKHPKWVLDYFLIRAQVDDDTEDPFIARRVGIRYDALDLAYNYYLDDLNQSPLAPRTPSLNEVNAFLQTRSDTSDQIDSSTLQKINTRLKPFLQRPGMRGKVDYLPSSYVLGTNAQIKASDGVIRPDYSTEDLYQHPRPSNQVSSLNRDALVIENDYPVMYFFVTSRHRYRHVTATLSNDKAYFAGIKEIAFLRERYSVAHDTPLYIESAGDRTNVLRNDFVAHDLTWKTYD